MDSVLYTLTRDGAFELAVRGEVVVWDGKSVLFHTGEGIGNYPARSVLKPIQFLACDFPAESWHHLNPSMALTCVCSLSATEDQVQSLREWTASSDMSSFVGDCRLPPVYPLDSRNRFKLRDKGAEKSALYHPCFGKHMNILRACKEHGWNPKRYTDPDHPFQESVRRTLEIVLGEEIETLRFVTDGCGLPTPVLSLLKIAKMYQALANATPEEPMGRIQRWMLSNPTWVGGKETDARLIQENEPNVIAKRGADGLLAVGVLPSRNFPSGLGVVAKLTSPAPVSWWGMSVAPVLSSIGLEPAASIPSGMRIHYHYEPFADRKPSYFDLSPEVSETTAVWPGDVPFQREISYDCEKGDHMTLSSIRTTVHVGTHADAPNHFQKGVGGIESVDLSKYMGRCQVIDVPTGRGTSIGVAQLRSFAITAKRILFKTGSFPDPNAFNEDFVSLSGELVEYLHTNGVILVGIDTPSVDPFSSKELTAHKTCLNAGMAILEGLELGSIESGEYELIALPLKLKGADASPARVILRPLPR